MQFKYKSINSQGETKESIAEAVDKSVLYRDLKEKGETIVSAEEIKSKQNSIIKKISGLFTGIKTFDKIIFAKNLSTMIDAGLPISRGLAVLKKQTKKVKLQKIYDDLNESIKKGNSLSDSMKDHPKFFSNLFVSMVKAGEESGSLAESLKVVAIQTEKSYLLRKKIQGAFIYPIIILCLMTVIGIIMLKFVVPTIVGTFKDMNVALPLSTRIIIFISDAFQNYFPHILLLLSILIFLGFLFIRSNVGKRFIDNIVLNMSVVGEISKEINSARTARTLSSLLKAGVDIVVATKITKEVIQNSYYKDILEKAEKSIQKGEPLANVFLENDTFYPPFVGEMISVGEETGKLSDMLMEVAVFYENEVEQKTKDVSTIIEPFLMIFIGVAVGFFAVAMISPTYSVMNNI
ncbi:MAG: type II secretion system F family protein [Candidatus Paceibacterota bacterium]